MDKVIQTFTSFEEAEEAEYAMWAAMDPGQRLRIGFELLYRQIPIEEFKKVSLREQVIARPLSEIGVDDAG